MRFPVPADVYKRQHVLGAAKANALCAQLARLGSVVRGIRIGADLQAAILVRPSHDAAELAANGSIHRRHCAVVNVAGGTVKACLLYTSS